MLLLKVAAATLVINVAAGPAIEPAVTRLSLQQKNAATQVYAQRANDCIARVVVADPRFHRGNLASNLGDLIVDSMPKCLEPVRAMIAAYDHYFGEGVGEEFFMGPYLDVLPGAVTQLTADMMLEPPPEPAVVPSSGGRGFMEHESKSHR